MKSAPDRAHAVVIAWSACRSRWISRFDRAKVADLGRLLESITPSELPALDGALRGGFYWSRPEWGAVSPAVVDALPSTGEESWPVLAVLACHPSGHVREKAIHGLAARDEGRAMRILLLRLNDWVPQVRAAARDAVLRLLVPAHAAELVSALPLAAALRADRRTQHADIADRIDEVVRRPESLAAVLHACRRGPVVVRRAALAITEVLPDGEVLALLSDLLRDPEPAIRRLAVGACMPRGAAAHGLARRALHDRSASVRHQALRCLAGSDDAESGALLMDALLDPDLLVREIARQALGPRAPVDLRAFILDALRTHAAAWPPDRLRGALLALVEWGKPDDAECAASFLDHPSIRVRTAAVRAFGTLGGATRLPRLLELLAAEEPGVSREARRALRPRATAIAPAILRGLVADEKRPRHVRRGALDLAATQSKWVAIESLLLACGSSDAEIVDRAQRKIASWLQGYNRSFILPRREDADRLESQVRAVEALGLRDVAAGVGDIIVSLRRLDLG